VLIHVDRSSDPEVWTGQFVLGSTGLWHLLVQDVPAPSGARGRVDPRCLPELPVVVSAAGGPPQPSGSGHSNLRLTLLLAIAIAVILVGTALFVVLRSRVRVGRGDS